MSENDDESCEEYIEIQASCPMCGACRSVEDGRVSPFSLKARINLDMNTEVQMENYAGYGYDTIHRAYTVTSIEVDIDPINGYFRVMSGGMYSQVKNAKIDAFDSVTVNTGNKIQIKKPDIQANYQDVYGVF